jgi:hypothetical protein
MKKYLNDFWITILLSAGLGIVIGFFELAVEHMSGALLLNFLVDATVGACVGSLVRLVFVLLYMVRKQSKIFTFIIIFLLIGCASLLPFVFYVFADIKSAVKEYITVFSVAEILGLTLCYRYNKAVIKINECLRKKQKEIEERI